MVWTYVVELQKIFGPWGPAPGFVGVLASVEKLPVTYLGHHAKLCSVIPFVRRDPKNFRVLVPRPLKLQGCVGMVDPKTCLFCRRVTTQNLVALCKWVWTQVPGVQKLALMSRPIGWVRGWSYAPPHVGYRVEFSRSMSNGMEARLIF